MYQPLCWYQLTCTKPLCFALLMSPFLLVQINLGVVRHKAFPSDCHSAAWQQELGLSRKNFRMLSIALTATVFGCSP